LSFLYPDVRVTHWKRLQLSAGLVGFDLFCFMWSDPNFFMLWCTYHLVSSAVMPRILFLMLSAMKSCLEFMESWGSRYQFCDKTVEPDC
jgi:hypothetical protein